MFYSSSCLALRSVFFMRSAARGSAPTPSPKARPSAHPGSVSPLRLIWHFVRPCELHFVRLSSGRTICRIFAARRSSVVSAYSSPCC